MSVKLELPERVYWHRGCYQYKSNELDRASGMKSWVRLGHTPEAAVEAYSKLERASPAPPETLAWLLRWYLREIAVQLRERTQEDKRRHVEQISSEIGGLHVNAVRPADIQAYVFKRARRSPHQAKQELSTISQAFRWGRRFGLVDMNPATDIAAPRIKNRDRYVTDDELDSFCTVNRGWGEYVAMLAYATGQRLSDLLALRYSEPVLSLNTSKTNRKAVIELTEQLRGVILRLRPEVITGGLILVNRHGEPFTRTSFHQRWQLCMRRYEAQGGERFHFHDLKAKFVTDSQSLGLDPQVQALHDSPRTTKIYLRNRAASEVRSLI